MEYLGGSWSLYFDGDGPGLIGGLDALDLPSATDPPPILNFASPAGFAIVAAAAAADVAAPPVVAEPVYGPFTPVLDGFERTDPARVNNTNINYGLDPAEWSGSVGNSRVRISGGERTLTLRNNGPQTWIGDQPFGDSQEAYVTVARTSSTSSTVGVFLRATDLRPNGRFQRASSYVEVAYAPYLGGVIVRTKRAGSAGPDLRAVVPATFGSGDTLLARINVNGDLEVHRRSGGTWELLDTMELGYGAMAWPTADTPHGGRIGINTTLRVRPGRLDDFGGGDVL